MQNLHFYTENMKNAQLLFRRSLDLIKFSFLFIFYFVFYVGFEYISYVTIGWI